jgi:precorrin-2 dehydrogenase/sirohydrochlorin ferrochelatase
MPSSASTASVAKVRRRDRKPGPMNGRSMLPLFLNVTGRLCVVIGGGPVGRRKARVLVEAGAVVRLVCLEPSPDDGDHSGLQWIRAPYQPRHLDGAMLVFAAASPEINRQVVADAQARGLLVNAATEPEGGDFFLPAVVRRGPLTIGIGTEGTAPALAAAMRLLVEEQLDPAFTRWAELLAELRPGLLASIADSGLREQVLRHLCRPAWLERLRLEDPEQVRAAMLDEARSLLQRGAAVG